MKDALELIAGVLLGIAALIFSWMVMFLMFAFITSPFWIPAVLIYVLVK